MITDKIIAQDIKRIRKSRNLSQRELGALVGVSRDTIKDCELGRQRTPAALYENIKNLLLGTNGQGE